MYNNIKMEMLFVKGMPTTKDPQKIFPELSHLTLHPTPRAINTKQPWRAVDSPLQR
jgi:hypothetical protein